MEVKAAGVNRILYWMALCDCGTISAERAYDESLYLENGILAAQQKSPAEKRKFLLPRDINKSNSLAMRAKINMGGYSYIKVQGIYKEQGGSLRKEESYFVFDKENYGGLKNFLIKLGHEYDQDTITYADACDDFSLYETTPFYPTHGGRRLAPTGKRIANFSGFSIKRILQKLNPEDHADRLRCNELKRKNLDSLSTSEKVELIHILEKYTYQFFSEEDILTRIRGKGITWTNYEAVSASVNSHFKEYGEHTPTELRYLKTLCDTMPKYCLANADLLED